MAIFGKGRAAPGAASRSPPPVSEPPLVSPLVSPSAETVPTWNILPSYQLYESTFSKAVTPSADDFDYDRHAPPTYEAVSPDHDPAAPPADDYFGAQSRWENSILAHVHHMKSLAAVDADAAAQLQVAVELTAAPGERGVAPQVYDGESREFRQGDRVHGYVTVRNVSRVPLPFSMCSVVFEGKISVVGWDDRPPSVYKFLNMFEYTASWTPAWFDEARPEVDAADGTRLAFPVEKRFAPGVVYKKFFSFTVPARLLDCCCEPHALAGHCDVPPSLGVDKDMFLQRMRRARSAHRSPPLRIRDYGFSDTSLSYCVEARVVGKLSDYGGAAEEFVIVSHASAPVRVVPGARAPSAASDRAAAAYYATLVADVERCLAEARVAAGALETTGPVSAASAATASASTAAGVSASTSAPPVARRPSTAKHRQLYCPEAPAPPACFRVSLPYKKRSLTQPAKVVGEVCASTPKHTYVVPYVSPLTPAAATAPGLVVSVPVSLTYSATDAKSTPPEIKSVSAEIVACTLRSRKYPIPVELTPDMCVSPAGSFDRVVVAPFAAYLAEYHRLAAQVPPARLGISPQMVMDIKCLATLGVKTNAVKVPTVRTVAAGGLASWHKSGATTYSKHLDVAVDLASLFPRDSRAERECLVPSFQTCVLCRYYYMVVTVRLHSGEALAVKVAVVVEN